jgi:DNA repair protein RadC
MISIGSLNASLVHPREVFEPAVKSLAAQIIIAHNHPSGDPEPSEDDIVITRRLREAGEILGIEVLDHIIVAGDRFLSLRERGIID